jgi:hypothetical protein
MAIQPRFLYNNVLRGITPTWSGTSVSGSTYENALDWLDYSYFQANSGNLDFTMTANTDIDTLSIYVANFTGTGSQSIVLQYESSPSTFTTLVTKTTTSGKLSFDDFSGVTVSSGRKIRFVITVGTGALLIRQLVVGEAMTAERGQWASATPPTFYQGIKVTNSISQNGSILGRSIKRVEKQGQIKLDHLSASWVRSTWEPFAQHAARYAFIYQWNERDYPLETAFAIAQDIKAPNHTNSGLLSVDMPCRFLVADENAI